MSIKAQRAHRLSMLLLERKVSGLAIVAVLFAALIFGLVGFAVHAFWVLALVVLALGLGYVFAVATKGASEAR